jgi:lysophospholipase L1-like esterase
MLKKSIISNLIVSAFSFLITIILLEILLYFIHPIEYRQPPMRLSNDTWRELLHRPSSVPGLAYELVPNREQYSHGAIIRTNSFGMRDDEPHTGVDDSLHRIVVLGDSFTFGFGVTGKDTYPNVVERLLNEKIKDEQFEVLNLGTGGYSTHDEALVFEHKGMRWNPKLAVIGYVLNDPEIDPIQPLHSYFQETSWWQYSNILRLVVKVKNNWDIMLLGKGDYIEYLHAHQLKWQSVVEGLNKIGSIAKERNIPVLLLIFPMTRKSWTDYPYRKLHEQVGNTAKEKGLYLIDLYDHFSQYPPEDLMVAPGDSHPSRLGHELTAHAIYQWICVNHHLFSFLSHSDK